MQKILKKTHYHDRVARRKPHISAVNKQKNLIFANEYLNKFPHFWGKIIFLIRANFVSLALKG